MYTDLLPCLSPPVACDKVPPGFRILLAWDKYYRLQIMATKGQVLIRESGGTIWHDMLVKFGWLQTIIERTL